MATKRKAVKVGSTAGAAGADRKSPAKTTKRAKAKTAVKRPAAAKKRKVEAPTAEKTASRQPVGSPVVGPQVVALVSKLMQLADTGMGLGINMVSLLTSYAKSQIPFPGTSTEAEQSQAAASPQTTPAADRPPAEGEAQRNYCIVNRLPLHPGDPVQVSFSVNNDTASATKPLRISVLGFVGALQGFELVQAGFSVEPKEKVIGPMDFERFILKGKIPAKAPEDSYNGWILVEGDEQVRIPVMLLVAKQQG